MLNDVTHPISIWFAVYIHASAERKKEFTYRFLLQWLYIWAILCLPWSLTYNATLIENPMLSTTFVIQDISMELLSLLILCVIIFKPWNSFLLRELHSSVSISLWYVLNRTQSYWSYQEIVKGCALCMVIAGIFWILNGHQFCTHIMLAESKMLKMS